MSGEFESVFDAVFNDGPVVEFPSSHVRLYNKHRLERMAAVHAVKQGREIFLSSFISRR